MNRERLSSEPIKKIQLRLTAIDGNPFCLMGAFQRQARREGWTKEEITLVLADCQSSNYNHLLQVLIAHCDDPVGKNET